jgi:hypothetical protein
MFEVSTRQHIFCQLLYGNCAPRLPGTMKKGRLSASNGTQQRLLKWGVLDVFVI